MKVYIVYFMVLISIVFLSACKKAFITAPDSATLVVTVNPPTIPLGGQAVVKVVGYKASGTMLPDGTKIFFSTNIGSIEPEKETVNGVAEALFRSNDNRSGVATITIISGNAQTTPDSVTITIGSSALHSLSLSANPSELPIGGGFSTIRARAYDEDLNALSNIPVIFTTDAGQLNSKGSVIYTDTNGAAEDVLHTTNSAVVTAASGDISDNVSVNVLTNESPTASFVYSPTNPQVGEKVYFNAAESSDPDGTIVSYKWDFGDGRSATGQKPNHRYNQAGTYSVVLVVEDNSGNSASTSQSITIAEGEAPTASFVFSPTNPAVNEVVYFNASESSDDDGTIVAYNWDLGDGSGASGINITHTYTSAGTYTVLLVVTDDSGNTGSTSKTVSVGENESPTASFDYSPSNPKVDEDIYFNASDSSDPDGTIESYEWNFGDNTTDTGETVTHRYSSDGTFTVYLKVTDNSGNTGSTSQTITVSAGQGPTASFVYSPTNPITGESVYFNASASNDPDGSIVSYQWNFGDGKTGTGETPTHKFQSAGTYYVVLVVTDDDGNEDSVSNDVSVVDNKKPTASFDYSPSSPQVNETVYFDGSSSYDSDGYIDEWFWQIMDGGTILKTETNSTTSYNFTVAKSYTVRLRVTDDRGSTDTITKTVTVN
jgi:PKD repeat protein